MAMNRRTALKTLAAAGGGVAATASSAAGREPAVAPENAVGILYDATRCIGCQTCLVACRRAAPEVEYEDFSSLYDNPIDLSGRTRTIIKLFDGEEGRSFMKAQCMHCIDPACVSACMLGAFRKDPEFGFVTWDGDRCVGCRYCQIACPFGIPRFQWDRAFPKVVKCEMCADRIRAGEQPPCTEVCPREAVIFGRYDDLRREAHRRIDAAPERYNPHVYGETEGGGTQVLYLSKAGIPFEKLGLPALGAESVPSLAETIQHGVYQGFIAPLVLYGILGAVVWRNRRLAEPDEPEAESTPSEKVPERRSGRAAS